MIKLTEVIALRGLLSQARKVARGNALTALWDATLSLQDACEWLNRGEHDRARECIKSAYVSVIRAQIVR